MVVAAGLRRRATHPYLPRQLLHCQTQDLLDCSSLEKAVEGAQRGVEEAAAAGAYAVPYASVLALALRVCRAGRPVDVTGRGRARFFDPSNPGSDPVSPPENDNPVRHTPSHPPQLIMPVYAGSQCPFGSNRVHDIKAQHIRTQVWAKMQTTATA